MIGYSVSRPISRSGRLALSGCMLLVALVLGFAASATVYQINREAIRSSDLLGMLRCGSGQRVDDVSAGRRARRMVCRNGQGSEDHRRSQFVAFWIASPFVFAIAVPGLWFAGRANIWERRS